MGMTEFWKRRWPWVVGAAVLGGGSATGYATRDQWIHSFAKQGKNAPVDDGRAHDDGHGSHSAEPVQHVALTDQARQNLGLEIGPVTLVDYWRTVAVPGTVSEEPGHCERRISTTVNGIILKVHALQGQTVKPGDALFDIQPTSELLTNAQSGLLRTLQDLEIAEAEVVRLKEQVEKAGAAKNVLITKEAEKKRLESLRLVQMQELLVRGLSPDQIQKIVTTKNLIRQFTVRVPDPVTTKDSSGRERAGNSDSDDATHLLPVAHRVASTKRGSEASKVPAEGPDSAPHLKEHEHSHESVYTLEQLNVSLGKLVQPGEELCQLASHTVLLIEGHAFERENALLTKAVEEQWPVTALFETGDKEVLRRENLKILYVDNTIDETHRTLNFYVPLENEVVRDSPGANGLMYRTWRFKPGQKVRLLLPVQHLAESIVLPSDSVVKEGPDAYVYRQNGKLMEQVPVTIEHLDPREVVIKNDGSLFEGDEVARNQAYQLHLALKKAQGGGEGGGHHHDHDH
jgi:cobalt-zinc-cadmium efflux system membrane fusion protein